MPQLVPLDMLPDQQRFNMMQNARLAALKQAEIKGIISNRAVIRDAEPDTDFALAAREWLTAALVLVTPLAYVNARLAVNKVACFYAVYNEDPNPVITNVRFMQGPGTILGSLEVEPLYALPITGGYFDPVIYDPNDLVRIEVYPRLAKAGGERLSFGCIICEPPGEIESRPTLVKGQDGRWH